MNTDVVIEGLPLKPDDQGDEIAAGEDSRLKRWMSGQWAGLFAPPYLPGSIVVLGLLVTLAGGVHMVMQQPPAFWIDLAQRQPFYPFDFLLSYGLWAYAAGYLAYLAVLFVGLSILNRKAALVIWLLILSYHLKQIAVLSWCGLRPFFFFSPESSCQVVHAWSLALTALFFGAMLSGAVTAVRSEGQGRRPGLVWALVGVAFLAVLGLALGMGISAAAPQPKWRLLAPQHHPPARIAAASAYDAGRQRAVLFGGSSEWDENGQWIGREDTWEWNGQDWLLQSPDPHPPARMNAAMAYDASRGVTVLFGGSHKGVSLDDTWEWDGARWSLREPSSSPNPRCCFQMIYDPGRGKVVLYQGFTSDRTPPKYETIFLKDAWEWDGHNWQEISVDIPHAAHSFGMAYDENLRAPVILDWEGFWVWDGGRIYQPDLAGSVPARSNAQLVFHSSAGRLVTFGGIQNERRFNGAWSYRTDQWEEIITSERPPARDGHVLFFDAHFNRVIVFGGAVENNQFLSDTWALELP